MDEPNPGSRAWILLGAGLFAAAALLAWWATPGPAPGASARVDIDVEDADGAVVFRGTGLALEDDSAHVLGALLEAARLGNFTVEWTPGSAAFVTSIDGTPNAGACGWQWSLNGTLGDRAANQQPVRDGDRIRWAWGCEG